MGARLKQFRQKIGLTQEQLAQYLNMGRANYSRIEIGEVFISTYSIRILNSYFNVSLAWLIAGHGAMFTGLGEAMEEYTLEYSGNPDEIKKMLYFMEHSSLVRIHVLAFYQDFIRKYDLDLIPFKGNKGDN